MALTVIQIKWVKMYISEFMMEILCGGKTEQDLFNLIRMTDAEQIIEVRAFRDRKIVELQSRIDGQPTNKTQWEDLIIEGNQV